MLIKVLGSKVNANGAGNASTVGNATTVRCFETVQAGEGGSVSLITVRLNAGATIGTFELNGGSVEYLDKNPTDEVYDNTGNTSFTSVTTSG